MGGPSYAGVVARNAVVVLFVASLVALGVRSQLTEDTRFGWAMFSHQTDFIVRYEWVDASGEPRTVDGTADDLPGRQSIISGDAYHSTRYGVGAVRRWVTTYLDHLYHERRPPDAVSVRARIAYRIDGRLTADGDHELEVLSVPPATWDD